jgi:hypothetical protein
MIEDTWIHAETRHDEWQPRPEWDAYQNQIYLLLLKAAYNKN